MSTAAKELLVEKGVQTTTSLLERNDQCVVLRSRNRQQNLKDKDDSLASSAMLQQIDNGDDDSGDISGGCGPLSLTHRVTASSKKKPLHSLMKSKESDDSQKQQHNNHPSEKQSDLVANVHKCILTSSAVTKTNLKDLPTLPAKSPITPLNSNANNNNYSYPLS